MIACIIDVCNGDWNAMTESLTGIMTWYEEWYFFFEYIWGRTLSTWAAASRKRAYGINIEYLMRVFDNKLRMIVREKKAGQYIAHMRSTSA